MRWTRLTFAEPVTRVAFSYMVKNDLPYHNLDHITQMYQWLRDNDIPYDVNLDYAVMFHDAVYDDQPAKEARSALLFSKACIDHGTPNGVDVATVMNLINATADHIPHDELQSVIVRVDLHALTNPYKTYRNFIALVDEGMALYKVDELQVMRSMSTFLSDLNNHIRHNIHQGDPFHAGFYRQVYAGIQQSINMCRAFTLRFSEADRHDPIQSC